MPANSFTNARAAAPCSSRRRGIAACSALTAICLAHQYKKGERVVTLLDAAPARETAVGIGPRLPGTWESSLSPVAGGSDLDLRRPRFCKRDAPIRPTSRWISAQERCWVTPRHIAGAVGAPSADVPAGRFSCGKGPSQASTHNGRAFREHRQGVKRVSYMPLHYQR